MIVGYRFVCNDCGEYKVKKNMFEQFITENHRNRIAKQEKGREHIGIIKFEYKCPRCVPEGMSELKSTLKLRIKRLL